MSLLSAEKAPQSDVFGHEKPKTDEKSPDFDEKVTNVEAILVNEELAFVFTTTKELLQSVVRSDDTPANQQAQVVNSMLAVIEKIAKLRIDLYNADRVRRIEQTLIKTLRDFPRELQEKFLDAYERNLKEST